MKINTSGKVSKFAGRPSSTKNVSGLNIWGGEKSNEQKNTSNGFGGKTPDMYGSDTSNEQKAMGKTFKGFSPNRGAIDYTKGGDRSSNENPKGWKQ